MWSGSAGLERGRLARQLYARESGAERPVEGPPTLSIWAMRAGLGLLVLGVVYRSDDGASPGYEGAACPRSVRAVPVVDDRQLAPGPPHAFPGARTESRLAAYVLLLLRFTCPRTRQLTNLTS